MTSDADRTRTNDNRTDHYARASEVDALRDAVGALTVDVAKINSGLESLSMAMESQGRTMMQAVESLSRNAREIESGLHRPTNWIGLSSALFGGVALLGGFILLYSKPIDDMTRSNSDRHTTAESRALVQAATNATLLERSVWLDRMITDRRLDLPRQD